MQKIRRDTFILSSLFVNTTSKKSLISNKDYYLIENVEWLTTLFERGSLSL